jgi:hypothetical protein
MTYYRNTSAEWHDTLPFECVMFGVSVRHQLLGLNGLLPTPTPGHFFRILPHAPLPRWLAWVLGPTPVRPLVLSAFICGSAPVSQPVYRNTLQKRRGDDKTRSYALTGHPEPLRRNSNSTTPAATDTFNDEIAPAIGMRTTISQCLRTN